jgi:hypothetical protein
MIVFGCYDSEIQNYFFGLMHGGSNSFGVNVKFYSIKYHKLEVFITDPTAYAKIKAYVDKIKPRQYDKNLDKAGRRVLLGTKLALRKYLKSLIVTSLSTNFNLIDEMIKESYEDGHRNGRRSKAQEIQNALLST